MAHIRLIAGVMVHRLMQELQRPRLTAGQMPLDERGQPFEADQVVEPDEGLGVDQVSDGKAVPPEGLGDRLDELTDDLVQRSPSGGSRGRRTCTRGSCRVARLPRWSRRPPESRPCLLYSLGPGLDRLLESALRSAMSRSSWSTWIMSRTSVGVSSETKSYQRRRTLPSGADSM